MPYEFLDDLTLSDEAFRAAGATLDELFISSWSAVLHLLIDNPEELQNCETRRFSLENTSIDLLLYDFLEKQLYFKDTSGLFLLLESVAVKQQGTIWTLTAEVRGEELDMQRHLPGTDVKAITMYGLQVTKESSGWVATVVVDV